MPSVRLRPRTGGAAERLGYRLDRFLALHPIVQLLAVLVWATLLALLFGAASLVFAHDPTSDRDGGLWWAITHMLDGGTVAADSGIGRRLVGVGVTLIGMVLVAVVTGAFASSFADRMRDIRRGTFSVFERGHTLMLGYGVHAEIVLRELAASGVRATVVVVTAQDREVIEERVREVVAGARHRLRIIVRRADPTTTGGVRGAAAAHARAVLILPEIALQAPPDGDRPPPPFDADDRTTMRTLLAARRVLGHRKIPIVVESTGEHGRELIELCAGASDVTIVEEGDVGTHLLVHAVRQPGVLDVVRQILALDATSVYEHGAGPFTGRTFEEAHASISRGVLIGLLRRKRNLLVPPGDTRIEAADRLLVFADDPAEPSPTRALPHVDRIRPPLPLCATGDPVHVLVVGYRRGLPRILRSLRTHFVAEITLLAPPEHAADARAALAASGFPESSVAIIEGHRTDVAALARAAEAGPTRLLLLAADPGADSPADFDAEQLVTLLHLRRIASAAHADTPAVVEIRSAETERLVSPHHATDFVLLHELTGMLLAQELHALCRDASAGAWLGDAFLRLLNDLSTRIWLHPMSTYVPEPARPSFEDVLVAARRRGEVALGVRSPRSLARLLPPRDERIDPRDTEVVVIGRPEREHPHASEKPAA